MSALAVGQDQRRDDLHAVDDAAQVYAQRAIPGFEVRFVGVAASADAGVVAEQMDSAERANALRGRRPDLVAVTDVRVDEVHVVAPGQSLPLLLEILLVEINDDHLHAEPEEVLHQPVADAACATRDERDPAGKVLHRVSAPRP